jgi:hypothetical protein
MQHTLASTKKFAYHIAAYPHHYLMRLENIYAGYVPETQKIVTSYFFLIY